MAHEAHRTLEVLEEISSDERVTQRSLSRRLGISLGMANIYLKRLVRKGYIKVTTVPGKRLLRYMLTRQGLAEKTRLTYEFAEYSYRFLRSARSNMLAAFKRLSEQGVRRVGFLGTGELAELAYLALVESDLTLVGVVSSDGAPASFLGHKVLRPSALREMDVDAIAVFSPEDLRWAAEKVGQRIRLICLAPGTEETVSSGAPPRTPDVETASSAGERTQDEDSGRDSDGLRRPA